MRKSGRLTTVVFQVPWSDDNLDRFGRKLSWNQIRPRAKFVRFGPWPIAIKRQFSQLPMHVKAKVWSEIGNSALKRIVSEPEYERIVDYAVRSGRAGERRYRRILQS